VRFGVTKSIANGFEDVLFTLACTVAKGMNPRGFSFRYYGKGMIKIATKSEKGRRNEDLGQSRLNKAVMMNNYKNDIDKTTYSLLLGIFQAMLFVINPKPTRTPALPNRVALLL